MRPGAGTGRIVHIGRTQWAAKCFAALLLPAGTKSRSDSNNNSDQPEAISDLQQTLIRKAARRSESRKNLPEAGAGRVWRDVGGNACRCRGNYRSRLGGIRPALFSLGIRRRCTIHSLHDGAALWVARRVRHR
uniref:Uncharacterized protein n=1 Tax=Plectus sambesii TaxID=2011161 RepID=A0A914WJP5_9BILA